MSKKHRLDTEKGLDSSSSVAAASALYTTMVGSSIFPRVRCCQKRTELRELAAPGHGEAAANVERGREDGRRREVAGPALALAWSRNPVF